MNRLISELKHFFKKWNAIGVVLIVFIFALIFLLGYPTPPVRATSLSYDATTYFNENTSTFNSTIFVFDGQGFAEPNLQVNYVFYIDENGTGTSSIFKGSGSTNSQGFLLLSEKIGNLSKMSTATLMAYNMTYSGGFFSHDSTSKPYSLGEKVTNPYFMTCVFGQTNLEDRSLMVAYLPNNLSQSPEISIAVETTSLFGGGYQSFTLIGNYSGFTVKNIPVSSFLFKNYALFDSFNFLMYNNAGAQGQQISEQTVQGYHTVSYLNNELGLILEFTLFLFILLLLWFTEDYFVKPMKNGTMESVISKPVGRRELYLLRFSAVTLGSIIILLADIAAIEILIWAFARTLAPLGALVGTLATLTYFLIATTSLTFMLSTFGGKRFSNRLIFLIILLLVWVYVWFLFMFSTGLIPNTKILSPAYKLIISLLTLAQYTNPFTIPYLFNDILTKSILIPGNAYGPLYQYGINPVVVIIAATCWILIPFIIGFRRMKKIDF